MGGNAHEVEEAKPHVEKGPVDLLICSCGDCLHWELGHNFIICKTCEHRFHATIIVPEHDKLQWQQHER